MFRVMGNNKRKKQPVTRGFAVFRFLLVLIKVQGCTNISLVFENQTNPVNN